MQIMKVLNTYEFSSSDSQQYRYWSATQPYASGDQLARYLQAGWGIGQIVEVEQRWFGEARFITIYRVQLFRDGRQVAMRVMGNPFIRSLLRDPGLSLKLVPFKRDMNIRFEVINR
jgi:hypothetical protein